MPVRAVLLGLVLASPASAQSAAEVAFARQVLAGIQGNSFDANREYCGIIGLDADGRLVASRPRKGRTDSCKPRDPRDAVEFIASYHTHGGFDEWADSEVPSTDDVLADMEEGLDGYLATPGGRLWFIDGQQGIARQICGVGCMPSDPDFEPEVFGLVKQRYTLSDLDRREDE